MDYGRGGDRRERSGLALLITLALATALIVGLLFSVAKIRSALATPDYHTSADASRVTVEVKPGDLLVDMARKLKSADVVASEQAFVDAAGANSRSRNIQPGFYQLRTHMSGADAVAALLDLDNKVVTRVTIPEGMITVDIYQKLSEALGIPVDDFVTAAKDPVDLGVPDWWFHRTDGKKAARGVEGFLFPATYEFPPNMTARAALAMMVQQFLTVTDQLDFAGTTQSRRHISPYEALIAASIAQAEAMHDEDFGKVSRVLYNRVYAGEYPVCKCLKVDSTVNYWLRLRGKDSKNSSDLFQHELDDRGNPYNTHVVDGLPLGPIGNPGEAALRGAMDPPAGNDVFFVTVDQDGTMGYAATEAGFQKLVQDACRNHVLRGSAC